MIPPTIQVDKSTLTAGDVTISWEDSCSVGATDVRIYEGTLGNSTSHAGLACTDVGADKTEEVSPSVGSTYYLVVPVDAMNEGSYGFGEEGLDRPARCTGSL
jgi:hypothetical protein